MSFMDMMSMNDCCFKFLRKIVSFVYFFMQFNLFVDIVNNIIQNYAVV